jgi:hypothetical protein
MASVPLRSACCGAIFRHGLSMLDLKGLYGTQRDSTCMDKMLAHDGRKTSQFKL